MPNDKNPKIPVPPRQSLPADHFAEMIVSSNGKALAHISFLGFAPSVSERDFKYAAAA